MKTVELAIVGGILIVAGLAWAAILKPAAEAYSLAMDSQRRDIAADCRDQIIAAALVEELALHCPGAADYGHTEGSIALCALAGGRTPEQVARLQMCKGVVPRLEAGE